ncbi:hypothetical protein M3Y97_01094400 [Aphelenchoides bicaudatus]|nr:hypothetical protein M3Y97_01094400 [Aphelenchoides bicaudatus]
MNVDDENEVCQFVKSEMFNGKGPMDTFRRLLEQIGDFHHRISQSTIETWFGLEEDDNNQNSENLLCYFKVPGKYRHLISIIRNMFRKAQCGISERICPDVEICNLCFLSERYSLDIGDFCEANTSLWLFDSLYGQKRCLKIIAKIDIKLNNICLAAIDSAHFFFINRSLTTPTSIIYLMQLNSKLLECTVLDTLNIDYVYEQCFFDLSNRQNFVFRVVCEDKTFFVRGNLNDSQIQIDEKPMLFDFNVDFNSFKLEGNKLYAFQVENVLNSKLVCCEFVLNPSQIDQTSHWIVNMSERNVNSYELILGHYVWIENVCYSLKRLLNNNYLFYKIDLDTRQLTELNNFHDFDQVTGTFLLNNKLLVSTVTKEMRQHRVLEILLNTPNKHVDNLFSLCMRRIQKILLFVDTETFDDFINQLPPVLRPFGQ